MLPDNHPIIQQWYQQKLQWYFVWPLHGQVQIDHVVVQSETAGPTVVGRICIAFKEQAEGRYVVCGEDTEDDQWESDGETVVEVPTWQQQIK